MISYSLKLGTAFNIPIFIHWSVLLAIGGVAYSLGLAGIALSIMVFASILAHEYAHALTARKYVIQTSKITLHYFGGAASIDLTGATPKQEAVIAGIGPVSSLCIALIFLLMDLAVAQFASGRLLVSGVTILSALGIINIGIAAFNMLPIFPMDGGRILRAALQSKFGHVRATQMALNVSVVLALALVGLAIVKIHALLTISIVILVVSFLLKVSYRDAKFDDQMP